VGFSDEERAELIAALSKTADMVELLLGEELIFSVNAYWRRMRVFPSGSASVRSAVAETMRRLRKRGWSI
jgi:hypothetical protein